MQKRYVVIRKKDAAFVYAILESLEGMVAFSTVEGGGIGADECMLRVLVPKGSEEDIGQVFDGLSSRIPLSER